MRHYLAERAGVTRCQLGEGMAWDQIHRRFLWVDICGGNLCALSSKGEERQILHIDDSLTAVFPLGTGDMILSTSDCLYRSDAWGQNIERLVRFQGLLPNERLNDGAFDRHGNLFIGTVSADGTPSGALFRVKSDCSISRVMHGVTCSNGIAFSDDMMYYIDSPRRALLGFCWNEDSGVLNDPVVLWDTSGIPGVPDGMTIDAKGRLWVAFWGGGRVACFDPALGECVAQVDLPTPLITSCAFDDRKPGRLMITTAAMDEAADDPMAGFIYLAETEAAGVPAKGFLGNWPVM